MARTGPSGPRPRFVLLGGAGFVAPRHYEAILASGGELVAVLDPHDSIGVLDRYFPEARYFREFERLDRYVEHLRLTGAAVDFVSVCTPNHLHDAGVRWGLRAGAHVICEKPLVINPWNALALHELSIEVQRRVVPVLQLRYQPALAALRERALASAPSERMQVELTYVTPRGPWYQVSWKGDEERSGGVIVNIGIHFLDLLLWLFGNVKEYLVEQRSHTNARGRLLLERAEVSWMLSIDAADLPSGSLGRQPFRRFSAGGTEYDLSTGMADLHGVVYREAVAGRGYGVLDALSALVLGRALRTARLGVMHGSDTLGAAQRADVQP